MSLNSAMKCVFTGLFGTQVGLLVVAFATQNSNLLVPSVMIGVMAAFVAIGGAMGLYGYD